MTLDRLHGKTYCGSNGVICANCSLKKFFLRPNSILDLARTLSDLRILIEPDYKLQLNFSLGGCAA